MSTADPPVLVIDSYESGLDIDLSELAEQFPEHIRLIRAQRFAGTAHTLQAVVPLVPVTVGVLSLVATWIRAKRHMSVKVAGVEITGMSSKEVEHILRILSEGGTADEALDLPSAGSTLATDTSPDARRGRPSGA